MQKLNKKEIPDLINGLYCFFGHSIEVEKGRYYTFPHKEI